MSPRSSGPVFTQTDAEGEVGRYRPLCALAVVALVVGMLSAVALFALSFLFLPVLGIVLGAVSLRRVGATEPPLVGRSAALAGLGLSLTFAIAAPICSGDSLPGLPDFSYYRWNMREEAQQFGMIFFDLLAAKEPEKACQLFEIPASRHPFDAALWGIYAEGSDARAMLDGIVSQRPVHALLLLGNRATVRYYETESQSTANDRDKVVQSFAVTFDSAKGEKQTFFVRLYLERSQMDLQQRAFWRVERIEDEQPVSRGGKPPQT
jgi:hypothetical protein